MKTYFICFSLKNSSVAEFFVKLCNKLSESSRVFIISYDDRPQSFGINPNIQILNWPSPRPVKWIDFKFIYKLIRKYRPDSIISNFGAVNLSLFAGYIAGVKSRICWYHTHSSAHSNEKKFLNIRKRYIYRMATLIITNSEAAKADLEQHYGVHIDKIEVFPNAVKVPSIEKAKVVKRKIVFAGRLHPVKGLGVLLGALPAVIEKHPDTEMVIFGGHMAGDEISTYKKAAKKLGIESNLIFKGFKPKEEVLESLAEAYMCVVPSYFEAFCYVVIESFSVSTPVIGSKTTGVAELIRNGKEGFLFETGNSSHLSEKILELFENPEQRNIMAQNAKQRFLENYELDLVINKLSERLNA